MKLLSYHLEQLAVACDFEEMAKALADEVGFVRPRFVHIHCTHPSECWKEISVFSGVFSAARPGAIALAKKATYYRYSKQLLILPTLEPFDYAMLY